MLNVKMVNEAKVLSKKQVFNSNDCFLKIYKEKVNRFIKTNIILIKY